MSYLTTLWTGYVVVGVIFTAYVWIRLSSIEELSSLNIRWKAKHSSVYIGISIVLASMLFVTGWPIILVEMVRRLR